MKILLAIDGSRFSDAAVGAVIAQARPEGTEIRVIHVVEPPSLLVTRAMGEFNRVFDNAWEEELKFGKSLVEDTAASLVSHGFKAIGHLEDGDPKSKIVEAAKEWGADLIVVGSHGRKGLEQFLLGSVSETVVRHADCSVEVVRLRGIK